MRSNRPRAGSSARRSQKRDAARQAAVSTTPEGALASPEGIAFVRRLGTNTIAQMVGLAGGTALGFLNFLAVTRGLGPDAFGDLTAATIFLLFPVALADLGLATGVLREISISPDRAEYVIRASLPLRAVLGAPVLFAALALSVVLPYTDRAQSAIWLSAIGTFVTFLALGLNPLFQARLQMHVPVAATLAGRALTLVLIVLALATGHGFREVVLAYVAGAIASAMIVFVVAARSITVRPLFAADYWPALLRGSLVIGIATGVFISYYRIDAVLVALLRDSREAGLYGAAFKFVEIAEVVVAAVGITVFPSLARLIATEDARIGRAIQRSVDVVLAVGVPVLVGILFAADDLVVVTAGEDFAPAADALRLLVPYLALLFADAILIRVATALHADKLILGIALAVLVLNVALNLLLIPLYGYKAAALTSAASEACVAAALFGIARRWLAFRVRLQYVWVVGVAAAAMAGIAWLLPLRPLLAAAIGGFAYGLVVLALPGTVRDVATAFAPSVTRVFRWPRR
jgi:O-antigen/teichoic acid export membrane protein